MDKIISDKAEKFWNKRAKGYDGGKDASAFKPGLNVSKTREFLKGNETLLDFGCATGTFVALIADSVDKIIGVDISSKMIDLAEKKKTELNISNAEFVSASIFDEKFIENTFDVITCFNVFHLLEDIPKTVKRLSALLRPDGLLISSTPCLSDKIHFKVLAFFMDKLKLVPNVKSFTNKELLKIVSGCNLEIIEQSNVGKGDLNSFIVCKQ